MDIRLVNDGPNQGPITAANVRALTRANALVVVQVNVSGDIVNPGGSGGSGGDGAILDGANNAIKASVKSAANANPLHVIITNASGDLPNLAPPGGSGGPIFDGSNNSIKSTVKQYSNSNPVAVVLVNASGDAYNGNQSSVSISKWNLVPTQDAVHINSGVLGVTGDVSTTPKAGQIWPVAQQTPIGVQIIGGGGGSVAPSGDFPVRVGSITAPVGITGDVSTIPKAGQVWPVSQQSVIGVQIIGGGTNRVSISGDQINVSQQGAWAVAGTGDFSTIPKAGQVWSVSQQSVIGVQVVGGGTNRVSISGDTLTVSQQGAWAIALTGDSANPINTKPAAGQTWPVREQGVVGAQIVGGAVGGQVGITGDQANPINVEVALITAPVGITGDVSTKPAAGQTWPVREQGVVGVQVVGGQVGGSHGVTGDVTVKPSTSISAGIYFPASGDFSIADGANKTIKGTVKNYTRSNPVAVVLVNASGDAYNSSMDQPAPLSAAGRVSSGGSNQIVAAVAGKRIKVFSYSLQGDGDNARGFFASGASGSQLSVEWELASREGVVKQIGSESAQFLFATTAGAALSFESSSSKPMKYEVGYQVDDAT